MLDWEEIQRVPIKGDYECPDIYKIKVEDTNDYVYVLQGACGNYIIGNINNGKFEAEDSEVIKEVEKILQPFNISFGNRVLKQIEEFVKIYCACFNNPEEVIDEAVEKILLSKVVAKLEFKNVDNKDKLVKQFNKLNLYACSEFVSKLNED